MRKLSQRGDPAEGLAIVEKAGKSTFKNLMKVSKKVHSLLGDQGVTTKRKRKRRKVAKKKSTQSSRQWYHPKTHSGWSKSMPARKRRRLTLKAHHGNLLEAGRAKQALANVTKDPETKVKAQADAKYFFAQHRKEKE